MAGHHIGSHCQYVLFTTTEHAHHCIEFGHVAGKVHLICSNSGHAHDELGRDVEHGKEYDREVVSRERSSRLISPEEDFPSAELEGQRVREGFGITTPGGTGTREMGWVSQ